MTVPQQQQPKNYINEVHKMASDVKGNVKKEIALNCIESLIREIHSHEDQRLKADCIVALATLYKYFQPKTVSAKPKNELNWVQKAISKDQYRGTLAHSYYDGENFVSTDGKRLHVTFNNKLEKIGYYDKSLNYIVDEIDIGTYPDWKSCIPDTSSRNGYTGYRLSDLKLENLPVANPKKDTPLTKITIKKEERQLHVNTQFWNDALSLFKVKGWETADTTVYIKDGVSPIKIEHHFDTFAVMMPVKEPKN